MTQGKRSKRRPENADAYRANHDRIFATVQRVRVPMPTQSGVPLMAQNDDPPYPRIIPRKELKDPYA